MRKSLADQIATLLNDQLIGEGHLQPGVPGLHLMRAYGRMPPTHMLYRPTLCIVAQGAKEVMVGDRTLRYGAGQTMVVTVEAPVLSELVEASKAKPYIGAILELDLGVIIEVAAQLGERAKTSRAQFGFEIHTLDDHLMDAVSRLLALVERPGAIEALYPSLMREIAYWLLHGPAGASVLRMIAPMGQPERLTRVTTYLLENFDTPVSVADLARMAGMSASAFHQNFKALTGLSPLQYHKHIRLLEARRRLLRDGSAAASAALAVGYESVSHFSREYARMFGAPPRREARERIRQRRADPRLRTGWAK